MVSRTDRRKRKESRIYAEKLFEKHHRHNRLRAVPGVHECVIILDNLKPSFNIGKIFRSAEAFGIREIHLVGTTYFDAKSAKGSFKWVPAHFHEYFDRCYQLLNSQGYRFYLFEPGGGETLFDVELPRKSAYIFGHEEFGVSFERNCYPDIAGVRVEQIGRVESLNVSVAASIAMYEYIRRYRFADKNG